VNDDVIDVCRGGSSSDSQSFRAAALFLPVLTFKPGKMTSSARRRKFASALRERVGLRRRNSKMPLKCRSDRNWLS